jgi:predicted DNA-binding transcriptional regulator YafY
MKNESQNGLLLLRQYLYERTDEQHPASVADILAFWQEHGIQAGRKSVYTDIELLQNAGMDIVCVKSSQNRYFVGQRLFELPELKLLVDAVESSRFITEKKSTALIKKLGHLTSTAQAEQLNRRIYMGGTPKPENEGIYYNVDTIHNAVQKKQQITFRYFEYTPKKEKILKHDGYKYRFSPYAMIWNRDCYYAVGWSEKHGKIAQFRVDRMTAVEPLEQTAVQTPDFDPAEYVRKVFGMYPDNLCTVELLCDNEVMRSVIDRFGENVQTETVDEQHFRATVEVAPSPPFFSWVFTFSGKIRIVSPAAVLEEMRDMAAWLK